MSKTAKITHKTSTGRHYCGIPIHAVGGVHEAAAGQITKNLPYGKSILELGAGSGAMTQRLLDLGYEVTPLDLDGSTWQCSQAQPLLVDLNCPTWPHQLGGRKFGSVVALEIIEHLDNPRQFFRNLRAVTPPGGLCFLSTPSPTSALSVAYLVRKGTFYCFSSRQFFSTGHVTILPWWLVACLAEEAGFSVIDLRFVGKMDGKGLKVAVIRLLGKFLRRVRKGPYHVWTDDGLISLFTIRANSSISEA